MIYTVDNIEGLRVRRGGIQQYYIASVHRSARRIMLKYGGYLNDFSLDKAIEYLNSGRWSVVGEKIQELVYEIY